MNLIRLSVFLFAVSVMGSCSKEDDAPTSDGMVKTVDSVAASADIGMVPLDDGNFIVVNNNKMIKLNSQGIVIWKKPLSQFQYTRTAFAIPGTGFGVFGMSVQPATNASNSVCRYDNDGNFLDEKTININAGYMYSSNPAIFIRMANGNYAFALNGISWSQSGYLKILDSDFNLIYSRFIPAPPGYYNFTVMSIAENTDGGIVVTGSMGGGNLSHSYVGSALVVTETNGINRSFDIAGDTTYNSIAFASSPYSGGYFSVASTMTEWNSDDGSFVEYYGITGIAGTMRIDLFDHEGEYTGSRPLTSYPGFGLVKTIRKTPDGGYVLCGTVGNNGSSVSVSKTKIYVCKLDANLNEVWTRVIATPYQAIGVGALPVSDGGMLVTGNVNSYGVGYQLMMIKTDAHGNY